MIPLGGFLPGGAVGIWGLMAPLGALVFGDVRSGIRWIVAFPVYLATRPKMVEHQKQERIRRGVG